MLRLLFGTCQLMLVHMHHCVVYALPSLLFFFLTVYFLHYDGIDILYVAICLPLFLIASTLFLYAICREFLAEEPHAVNILNALIWRREHLDFFLFIVIGMALCTVLTIYCVEAVDILSRSADSFRSKQFQAQLSDPAAFITGIYTVLASGSRLLSFLFLALILWGWMYICRVGIRIPAYVEGYYLRSREACELMRQVKWSVFMVSLLFTVATTSLVKIIADSFLSFPMVGTILAWLAGYFILSISHLSMWVNAYNIAVKESGYMVLRRNWKHSAKG